MEQLSEHVIPIRGKVTALQSEVMKARQEKLKYDYDPTPSGEETNDFAKATHELLSGELSFEQKRAIVLSTVEKIVGTQEKLQVSGYIPVTTNGWYTTKDRHRRIAERGEVHAF